MTDKKEKKKNKKKGPIRTGAVVPFIVVAAATVAFSMFLLDSTLKKTFEFVGTKVNGAEVNVAEVVTSFKTLNMEIKGVQFTNKDQPSMNSFEIGRMNFSMLWDALLRGKILIDDIAVNDIMILTKRKSPGHVLPPPPPEEIAAENKKVKEMLGKAQKEFDGNIFGDIAGMLAGNNKIDDGAKSEIKSKQRIAQLQKEITAKEKEVSKVVDNLPTKKDFNALQGRFNKIRWNDLSNIAKAPKVFKEIDKVKKDADKMIKAYNNANKLVNNHIKYVDNATKQIPEFVNDDIKAIQKRMKIPSIDPKTIAQMLFGNEILGKMDQAQEYQAKIKEYLPPKKDKSEEKIKKPKRKIGINYKFGTPKSYPLFWIKRVNIDSKTKQGQMQGKITDITDNQNQVNKPTMLKITGDFPGIEIRSIDINGEFDHRNGAHDKMKVVVGSYPVKDKALSNTDDVKFIIAKADAKSVFDAKFDDDKIAFKLDNFFRDIEYNNSAKSENMDIVLKGVARRTKTITLKAKAKGKWDKLQWDIKSNLAEAIQNTVKAEIQAKINATKKKIKEDVERQIAGEKAKIMKQVNDAKAQYNKAIADGKKQLDNFKKQIDKKKKKEEKKGKKSLEKKGKDLLKKFKL